MMEIQLTETSKGKPALVLNGYMYSLKMETKSSKNWNCTKRLCKGKVTTSFDGKTILHADTTHNHAPDEAKMQTNLLRQSCKRKAQEDLSERPRKIIIKEINNLNTDKGEELFLFFFIRYILLVYAIRLLH